MAWHEYVFEDCCESMERSYEEVYSNNYSRRDYVYDPLFYFKRVKAVFNDYSEKAYKVDFKGNTFFFPKALVKSKGKKTYVHKEMWKASLDKVKE